MRHLEDVLVEYEFGHNMVGMTVIGVTDQNDDRVGAMLQLCWLEEPATEVKSMEEIEQNTKIILSFPNIKSINNLIDMLEECKRHVPC